MANTYVIEHVAYLKMILHATKHAGEVNGVLLGQKNGNEIVVSESIPLLHHWQALSPMMEIGLDLAQSHAAERQLKVVGYYQTSDMPEGERPLFPVGEKVASTVRDSFEQAFALVIDDTTIGSDDPSLIPFLPTSNSKMPTWVRQPRVSGAPPSPSSSPTQSQFRLADAERSPASALAAVREQGLHTQFGDFDDHLEEVTIDWLRNPNVTYLL